MPKEKKCGCDCDDDKDDKDDKDGCLTLVFLAFLIIIASICHAKLDKLVEVNQKQLETMEANQ